MNHVYEQLADEFVEQFCSNRGGNFTKEKLKESFVAGLYKKNNPNDGYHYFLAHQQGLKNGGNIL